MKEPAQKYPERNVLHALCRGWALAQRRLCRGRALARPCLCLRIGCLVALTLLFSPWAQAQGKPQRSSAASQTEGERNVQLNLDTARQNPLQLRGYLKKMPKGADLHNHLS